MAPLERASVTLWVKVVSDCLYLAPIVIYRYCRRKCDYVIAKKNSSYNIFDKQKFGILYRLSLHTRCPNMIGIGLLEKFQYVLEHHQKVSFFMACHVCAP